MKLVFQGFGLKLHQQGGNKHSQANTELNHAQVRETEDQTHPNKP